MSPEAAFNYAECPAWLVLSYIPRFQLLLLLVLWLQCSTAFEKSARFYFSPQSFYF